MLRVIEESALKKEADLHFCANFTFIWENSTRKEAWRKNDSPLIFYRCYEIYLCSLYQFGANRRQILWLS